MWSKSLIAASLVTILSIQLNAQAASGSFVCQSGQVGIVTAGAKFKAVNSDRKLSAFKSKLLRLNKSLRGGSLSTLSASRLIKQKTALRESLTSLKAARRKCKRWPSSSSSRFSSSSAESSSASLSSFPLSSESSSAVDLCSNGAKDPGEEGVDCGGRCAQACGVTAEIDASRTACVAPCAVFFDAGVSSATDKGIDPFRDLDYLWNFGDDPAAIWGVSGKTQNEAKGPMAGHVFERAGSYTVSLLIRDLAGHADTAQAQIAVSDPDQVFAGGNTRCVSTGSNFAGCPAGAEQVVSSDFRAQISWAAAQGGRRVLFRRGDSWNVAASSSINNQGPGLIGAFGACQLPDDRGICANNPLVTMTGDAQVLQFSDRVPSMNDWRVLDLHFESATAVSHGAIGHDGTVKQLLLDRLVIHGFHGALGIAQFVLDYYNSYGYPGHGLNDEIALVNSRLTQSIGGGGANIVGLAGRRLLLLGNDLVDATQIEHVIRIFWGQKAVLSHNYMAQAMQAKHVLKFHAPTWTQPGLGQGRYSEQIVISDNTFAGADNAWTVGIGPQDAGKDERVREVIFERNYLPSGPGTQVALSVWASQVTVRNNLFNLTGGAYWTAIAVGPRGIEPPPVDVRILNNTAYSADPDDSHYSGFVFLFLAASAQNTALVNNLACAPASAHRMLVNGTSAWLIQSNNIFAPASDLVNAAADNYRLSPGASAVNAGTPVPVFDDFDGKDRPQNAAFDVGAFERSAQ